MNVIQLDLQVVDPNKLVNIIYAVHPNSPVIVGFMIFVLLRVILFNPVAVHLLLLQMEHSVPIGR